MNAQSIYAEQIVPQWTFADRLRKARQIASKDQRSFAAELGCTASAYAQWEAGNSRPRDIVFVAQQVETLTQIPASWMLGVDVKATKKAPTANGGGLNVHPSGLEPETHWIRANVTPMRPRNRAGKTGPKGRAA